MRILFATDGSESAGAAGQFLAALPLPPGTRVQVVCVTDSFIEGVLQQIQDRARSWAQRVVNDAAAKLGREGVEVSGVIRTGDAAAEILAAARELGADLLVVGSRGLSGLEGLWLGSVARNVAKHAPCPVVVARAPGTAWRTWCWPWTSPRTP